MSQLEPSAHEPARQRIEALIEGVAEFARQTICEADFYHRLLEAAVQAGAARGAAVWRTAGDGRAELQAAVGQAGRSFSDDPAARTAHRRFLADAFRAGQLRTAPLPTVDDNSVQGPASFVLACPVRVDQQVLRIVEVCQRPDLPPDALRGYAAVLQTLCESAADFHRLEELRTLRAGQTFWNQAERMIERLHQQLDPEAVAFSIANDGRALVGCDRVAVAVRRGGSYRVLAVSGSDAVASSARLVQALQRLAGEVARFQQPLWHSGSHRSPLAPREEFPPPSDEIPPPPGPTAADEDLPPQLQSALHDYLDVSHSRAVAVLPLSPAVDPAAVSDDAADHRPADVPPLAVLIFETFTAGSWESPLRQRIDLLARHGRTALQLAERYGTLPLVHRLAAWRSPPTGRRWANWLLALLIGSVVVAALALVPADFVITCEGAAQPAARRQVFAPHNGRVAELLVEHGDHVAQNQLLATIDSPELSLQYARLLGEIQTAAEALNSVQAARLASPAATLEQRERAAQLTAEQQRLKKQLETLQRQRTLLEREREKQQIASPIAGQVLTWQLTELLQARPVQRGQVLMTIGDTRGPWVLELQIPDRDVSAVRQAQQRLGPELEVRFQSAGDPGTRRRGRLHQLATLVEAGADQRLSATAIVRVEPAAVRHLRPGAGVTARIHCGRRPLGYVWLRDLIIAVRSWLFV